MTIDCLTVFEIFDDLSISQYTKPTDPPAAFKVGHRNVARKVV